MMKLQSITEYNRRKSWN